MKPIRVVMLWSFCDTQIQRLNAAAPGLEVHQPAIHAGEDILPSVQDAQVLLAPEVKFDVTQARRLAWVQVPSAGVDHLLDHPLMRSTIRLTTASGIHAVPIGEHVLAMMLCWSRQLGLTGRWQQARQWPADRSQYQATELQGATLGIVGYGSIGRHVARLASGFGMRVLAVRRSPGRTEEGWGEPGIGDPAGEIPERIYGPGEVTAMLPLCDYVVVALPLTPETRHLIGARELASMKRSAYLVNISRGGVIDEPALVAALQAGALAGAGLDVFEREPLAADSPLRSLATVTLTPHVAGSSQRYNERLALLFAENLARLVQGRPLLNLVDPKRGY